MNIALLIRLLTGAQARWLGCTPDDPSQRIYFANHTSNLDGPTIWATLPPSIQKRTRPVAAEDYWGAGPVRRWLAVRQLNSLLIPRTGVTRANNPLRRMGKALDEGNSLILFPEGTRSSSPVPRLGPFRPGLFHLARKHPHVQCVPVYLENLNRILPKGEFLVVPVIAAVTFGAPLYLRPSETKESFLRRAHDAVEALGHGKVTPNDPVVKENEP